MRERRVFTKAVRREALHKVTETDARERIQ